MHNRIRASAWQNRGESSTMSSIHFRKYVFRLIGAMPFVAPCAQAQTCPVQQVYRLEYETICEQRQVTSYRTVYETAYEQQQVTSYRPAWVTETQERRYIVRKQLPETSYRDEQYATVEPVTTYHTQYVDQGCWQEQHVLRPGPVHNRLRWLSGACVIDPATGTTAYRPGGLHWVPEQAPSTVEVQRVWRPNPVAVQVPATQYVQKVHTRKVPVTTYRIVDEERVEQIPVQVCKMVAHQETVSVPRVVAKQVPMTYTYNVPRTVVRRVPVVTCAPTICCEPACYAPPTCCATTGTISPPAGSSGQPTNSTSAEGSPDGASQAPAIDPGAVVPEPMNEEA